MGFPGGSAGNEYDWNQGDMGSISGLGISEDFHGLYSPWEHEESDMTDWLSLPLALFSLKEERQTYYI